MERDDAIKLANKVLETPYRDPDDDLSMMSRQFLRAIAENMNEDGFYILEVENGERMSIQPLTQEEAGLVASNRIEKILSKSKANH